MRPTEAAAPSLLSRRPGALAAVAVLGVAVLALVPVPPLLLDLLLLGNLLGAAAVLLSASSRAGQLLRLPQLPTLLLCGMLLRLGLLLAALRLLLLRGEAGWAARTVGELGLSGDWAVGAALLLGLLLVQYLVVARGGERVAEVAARFSLDALPGRQAAIEADLRQGSLTPERAQAQRKALLAESQLYGALDGALRFVRGDAAAGLGLLVLGLLGCLYVGVAAGLSAEEVLWRYAPPLFGVALLLQVPALLLAAAAVLALTGGGAEVEHEAAGEVLLTGAPEALGLDEVQRHLDRLAATRPALLRETVPRRASLPLLSQVLRRLLGEGLRPLDLGAVLEALGQVERPAEDPIQLTEQVRGRMGAALLGGLLTEAGELRAVVVEPELEEALREAAGPGEALALEPDLHDELLAAARAVREVEPGAVLLCQGAARRLLARALRTDPLAPRVLAHSELPPRLPVVRIGRIGPQGFIREE